MIEEGAEALDGRKKVLCPSYTLKRLEWSPGDDPRIKYDDNFNDQGGKLISVTLGEKRRTKLEVVPKDEDNRPLDLELPVFWSLRSISDHNGLPVETRKEWHAKDLEVFSIDQEGWITVIEDHGGAIHAVAEVPRCGLREEVLVGASGFVVNQRYNLLAPTDITQHPRFVSNDRFAGEILLMYSSAPYTEDVEPTAVERDSPAGATSRMRFVGDWYMTGGMNHVCPQREGGVIFCETLIFQKGETVYGHFKGLDCETRPTTYSIALFNDSVVPEIPKRSDMECAGTDCNVFFKKRKKKFELNFKYFKVSVKPTNRGCSDTRINEVVVFDKTGEHVELKDFWNFGAFEYDADEDGIKELYLHSSSHCGGDVKIYRIVPSRVDNQALGVDPEDALGQLRGGQVAENFGYGELGLRRSTDHSRISLFDQLNVKILKVGVAGELSRDIVRRIFQRHTNELRFCYERELARMIEEQRPQGKVVVRFTIASTGAVKEAELESSELENASVENCVTQAFRRWTFPQPDSGTVEATITLAFSYKQSPKAKQRKMKKDRKTAEHRGLFDKAVGPEEGRR